MTIRWREEGDGFSRRERPVLPESATAADVRELLEAVREGGTFEGWIGTVETNARAMLDQGIDEARRERIELILRLIDLTRHEIEQRQPERSARYAVELGYLVRELELSDWERAADTGARVIQGGARGGPRVGAKARRDVQLAREFEAHKVDVRTNLSDTQRMIAVGKEHGLSRSASIAAIKRGLKKSSG